MNLFSGITEALDDIKHSLYALNARINRLEELLGKSADTPERRVSKQEEPFVEFPCSCQSQIVIYERIEPGQVGVIQCDNCRRSWTVSCPQLVLTPTRDADPKVLEELSRRNEI